MRNLIVASRCPSLSPLKLDINQAPTLRCLYPHRYSPHDIMKALRLGPRPGQFEDVFDAIRLDQWLTGDFAFHFILTNELNMNLKLRIY